MISTSPQRPDLLLKGMELLGIAPCKQPPEAMQASPLLFYLQPHLLLPPVSGFSLSSPLDTAARSPSSERKLPVTVILDGGVTCSEFSSASFKSPPHLPFSFYFLYL